MKKILSRLVATAGLTIMLSGSVAHAASASTDDDPEVFRVGDRTYYADGTVEVDVPAGTFSLGQCDSGQFCVWNQASYMGSFRIRTGSGSKTLGDTVGSFWNNRSSAARLYSNTGASSTCYGAGAKKASVTTGYSSASKVNLLTGAC